MHDTVDVPDGCFPARHGLRSMGAGSWLRRVPALGLCALTLAGCHTYTSVKCPSADITGQLGSVNRFQGTGGNFADLTYHATLTDVKGSCDLDEESVTVEVQVTLLADIGPAATSRSASFPYFVAVVDPSNRVIAKRVFDDPLVFPDGQRRAGATDTLTQRIPLSDPRSASDYHVFVGLQLTADELAYNRTHGGL